MAQILNTPTAAQTMSQQMGNPIVQSLQSLADMQLQNIQKKRRRQDIFAGLSAWMPQEQAEVASYLPEGVLQRIAPDILRQNYAQQQQQPDIGTGELGTDLNEEDRAAQKAFLSTLNQSGDRTAAANSADKARDRVFKKNVYEDKLLDKAKIELKPYVKASETAKKMRRNILESIAAAQTGKTRSPETQVFLDRVGLGDAFRSKETQALQKSVAHNLLGVADAFGPGMGKIMKAEFDAFTTTKASKFNTPSAIDYIGNLNLLKDELTVKKKEVATDIIKKNRNRVPLDLDGQIEEAMTDFDKVIFDKMQKLNKLFFSNKLPSWDSDEWNPANFEEETRAVFDDNEDAPMIIKDGIWSLDFDKIGKGK